MSNTTETRRGQAVTEDDLPIILTVKDVAQLLQISPKQVRALKISRVEGLGPRTFRFRRDDILTFLHADRQRTRRSVATTDQYPVDRQPSGGVGLEV